MPKMPWFRLHIDQWQNGVFGLKPDQAAVLFFIICELYRSHGFAKLDIDLWSRRCSMRPSSFRKAVAVLVSRGKITIEDGIVSSRTVLAEIESRQNLARKRYKTGDNHIDFRNGFNKNRLKYTHNLESKGKNNTTTISPRAESIRRGGQIGPQQQYRSPVTDEKAELDPRLFPPRRQDGSESRTSSDSLNDYEKRAASRKSRGR